MDSKSKLALVTNWITADEVLRAKCSLARTGYARERETMQ